MSKTFKEAEENFKYATEQVSKSGGKATNEEKLNFYALYKQATVGPCNTSQPWQINAKERAKWDVWNNLGKMSKEDAMVKYCDYYMDVSGKNGWSN
jgi:acyl-CoA-binding protein